MKLFRVLQILAVLLLSAVSASAMTVTLSVDGVQQTYNLSSFSIDAGTGTMNIAVTSTGGSSCTYTAPSLLVSGGSSSGTVGTPMTASISTDAAQVSANVGSIANGTWSWTPTADGTVTVTITATNSNSCNNTRTYSWSVIVGSGGTPPPPPPPTGSCTQLVGRIDTSLGPNESRNYCFTLTTPVYSNVQVAVSSLDWQGNVDIAVSDRGQPSCSEIGSYNSPPSGAPWYSTTGDSNEAVYLIREFPANTTFYVTACNKSASTSRFRIYGSGW